MNQREKEVYRRELGKSGALLLHYLLLPDIQFYPVPK